MTPWFGTFVKSLPAMLMVAALDIVSVPEKATAPSVSFEPEDKTVLGTPSVLVLATSIPPELTVRIELRPPVKVVPVAVMVPATASSEPFPPMEAMVRLSPVLKVSVPSSVRVCSYGMNIATFGPTVRTPSDAIVKLAGNE